MKRGLMLRYVLTTIVSVGCAGAMLAPHPAFAQPTPAPKPPAEIADLLSRLERGANRTADIAALAERDDAAPYLRAELLTAEGRYKRDIAEALRRIEARIWERTQKRFAWWAECRRFDLCAEVIVAAPTDREATDLVGVVTPHLNALGSEAERALELQPGAPGSFRLVPHSTRTRIGHHFSGDDVVIRPVTKTDAAIIRADRLEMGACDPCAPFVAVRSRLTYPKDGQQNEWIGAVVLVNNSLPLKMAEGTVFVCDGDVVFSGGGNAERCAIISNGSIRSVEGRGGVGSFLAATGNIDVTQPTNIYHAGGKVELWSKVPPERVKEHQKALPFGVRFVDPREFGLDLVGVFKAGAGVNRVEPGSVFARHDVRGGDLVTHANGVRVDSPAAFRRQLRIGVVRESLVLHLIRDGKPLARVVYLDGVPAPEAPAPRPRANAY